MKDLEKLDNELSKVDRQIRYIKTELEEKNRPEENHRINVKTLKALEEERRKIIKKIME